MVVTVSVFVDVVEYVYAVVDFCDVGEYVGFVVTFVGNAGELAHFVTGLAARGGADRWD